MNSPTLTASPKFKNLKCNLTKRSPIELKEKMRKNYRDKIQNCRNMLLTKFRGVHIHTEIQDTLDNIYKTMFNFSDTHTIEDEEIEVHEEVKKELIQEEFQWLLEEYEKAQADTVDWSLEQENNDLICPVCQKFNCTLQNKILACSNCQSTIKTEKSLEQIKYQIFNMLENHSTACSNEFQFTLVPDLNESHNIYLICDNCMEMQMVV
ncbi:RPA-interacting protein-like [Achroia grisella]|uniref:RPA-interacting protein-like n=1 Tax=Achroia grisella TaxID=688607 RepID=UPI0027D21F2C|nr:RPA-interacting protein-like [Achroia grisella]